MNSILEIRSSRDDHLLHGLFCRLLPGAKSSSYKANKELAEQYQTAKQCWRGGVERTGMGHWMPKPVEVETFYLLEQQSDNFEAQQESDNESNSSDGSSDSSG